MNVPLLLHSGGYAGDSSVINSTECINLYPERVQGEDTTTIALIGTPGLLLETTIGIGPHRGAHIFNGNSYYVSNNQLIKRDTAGIKTTIGTLSTTAGTVSMADSGVFGEELIIVDGVDGYICDGTTLTTISDSQFPGNPVKVKFMDGYFIVSEESTGFFYLSDFYDGLNWTTAGKANAERNPDNIQCPIVNSRLLWLIGETTTEVWWNSGNDFPFDPVQNGFIEWGTPAPDSCVDAGDYGVAWLAQNKNGISGVVHTQNLTAMSVTPMSILSKWRSYETVEDATAFVYEENGHTFYQLTFPTEDKTWVYDFAEKLWHERSSGSGRHRGQTHIYYNKKHLVGDYENSNLYEYDIDTYTDNTESILRVFTTQHISDEGQQLKHNWLDLQAEVGTGTLSGQGIDPVITLELSDDGGKTYGNARTIKYGIQGAYNKLLRWPLLGTPRDRVYRFSMSDPIKVRFKRLVLNFPDLPFKARAH